MIFISTKLVEIDSLRNLRLYASSGDTSITMKNSDEMIPAKFYLSQNYPNPFSDKTKIKYCVAFKTRVSLEVYNPKGEMIVKLFDEEQKAGTYEIEFDASNLKEGVYFYRLEAGNHRRGSGRGFTETKELNVLRRVTRNACGDEGTGVSSCGK